MSAKTSTKKTTKTKKPTKKTAHKKTLDKRGPYFILIDGDQAGDDEYKTLEAAKEDAVNIMCDYEDGCSVEIVAANDDDFLLTYIEEEHDDDDFIVRGRWVEDNNN